MLTRFFSTEGFGRKLLIFLSMDAVTATIQGIWSAQSSLRVREIPLRIFRFGIPCRDLAGKRAEPRSSLSSSYSEF